MTPEARAKGKADYRQIAQLAADATYKLKPLLDNVTVALRVAAVDPGCENDSKLATAFAEFAVEANKLMLIERCLADIHVRLYH